MWRARLHGQELPFINRFRFEPRRVRKVHLPEIAVVRGHAS